MNDLTSLRLQQSETQNKINEKCEELQIIEKELLNLEGKIVELSNLKNYCLSIPTMLRNKIKSLIKLVPALILLSTFLITSIVACMGYTLETGWQIKEIITALIASSSISTVASTSLAIYSYKSLKKDFSGYNLDQVSKELNENSHKFNTMLDQIDVKEKELNQLEIKLYELDNQIIQSISDFNEPQQKFESDTPTVDTEKQKIKSLNLNSK